MRLLVALGLPLVAGSALAQSPDPSPEPPRPGLEEIVVTAERRESTVQRTPLAVTAFDETAIERSRLNTAYDLQFQVPNLVYSQTTGQAQIALRGIGLEIPTLNGEPGVALYVDGVYQGRLFAAASSFSDLARIEVLRGPQGTLYGRNATGGALSLTTRSPGPELEVEGALEVGRFERIASYGAVGGPIVEDLLSARVSFTTEDDDGSRRNRFLNEDVDSAEHRSGRGVVEFTPHDDVFIVVRGDYTRDEGTGPIIHVVNEQPVPPLNNTPSGLGGTVTGDSRKVFQNVEGDRERTLSGTSVALTWQIDDLPLLGDAELRSLGAFRYSDIDQLTDYDGTEVDMLGLDFDEEAKQWSQELVLASAGDGDLDWIGGLFFYREDAEADYRFGLLGFAQLRFKADQDTTSMAAFVQGTYHITDRWRATAGVRVTHDRKDLTQSVASPIAGSCASSAHDDWTEWTPKFGTEFDASDDVLVYATITRGYKGGGYNLADCDDDYDPEFLWAYEAGVKSEWLDHRLRVNVAGFYYDYEDLQYNSVVFATAEIFNASDAEVYGAEVELVAAPFEGVEIDTAASYLHAEFEDFDVVDPFDAAAGPKDLKGNDLTRSPEWTFRVGAQYEWSILDRLFATVRYEYAWSDSYFFEAFNTSDARQDSYGVHNARVALSTSGAGWQDSVGDWTLSAFVQNALDQDVSELRLRNAAIGATMAYYGPPRTWGVRLAYRW